MQTKHQQNNTLKALLQVARLKLIVKDKNYIELLRYFSQLVFIVNWEYFLLEISYYLFLQ